MNTYIEANRERWNRLAEVNVKSRYYDVEGFREGESSLKSIELDEVGDVHGKRLLHLQCHFGMDTLSWRRLGAEVTGVDFSPAAIRLARELSRDVGLDARFIESDIYDLPAVLDDQFDIVFASYGVLCWLPDLPAWAGVIAHFLKPGGVFHLIDGHPINNVFENERDTAELRARYSYFHEPKPMKWEGSEPYADRHEKVEEASFQWTHSLGDVVNALIQAGLMLEHLNEFPCCVYDHFPFLELSPDGWYRFKYGVQSIPLTFSIKACRLSSRG